MSLFSLVQSPKQVCENRGYHSWQVVFRYEILYEIQLKSAGFQEINFLQQN